MMNKSLLSTGLCVFLMLGVMSCSDDDSNNDDNNGNNPPAGAFTANVDGEGFSSSDQVGATLMDGTFNITAIEDSTGETITITVTNASEGVFDIGGTDAVANQNGAVYLEAGANNSFLSAAEGGSGEIEITEIDEGNKTVSGIFSFKGIRERMENGGIITETVEITGGAFTEISYTSEVPGNPENSLTADVDGTPLNADSVTAIETNMGGSRITITAINNSTNQNVGLIFPGDISVGEYQLEGGFSDYTASYNPNLGGMDIYYSQSGTLKITSRDMATGVIEGTFDFVAKNAIDPEDTETPTITNGSFSVVVQ